MDLRKICCQLNILSIQSWPVRKPTWFSRVDRRCLSIRSDWDWYLFSWTCFKTIFSGLFPSCIHRNTWERRQLACHPPSRPQCWTQIDHIANDHRWCGPVIDYWPFRSAVSDLGPTLARACICLRLVCGQGNTKATLSVQLPLNHNRPLELNPVLFTQLSIWLCPESKQTLATHQRPCMQLRYYGWHRITCSSQVMNTRASPVLLDALRSVSSDAQHRNLWNDRKQWWIRSCRRIKWTVNIGKNAIFTNPLAILSTKVECKWGERGSCRPTDSLSGTLSRALGRAIYVQSNWSASAVSSGIDIF